MAITREQALNANEFHYYYPNTKKCEKWRRNGMTQTWKTRPTEFRIPVKHGLYAYGNIKHTLDLTHVYTGQECPHCSK